MSNYEKYNRNWKKEFEEMDYKDFINRSIWSLDDYQFVINFLSRVKQCIHEYGAFTVNDLKDDMLFMALWPLNNSLYDRKKADHNRGWTASEGFDFEIIGKHSFKVIVPWDAICENLDSYYEKYDHECSILCGTKQKGEAI